MENPDEHPALEEPEEQIDRGGMCFLNNERYCAADCLAYAPAPIQLEGLTLDQSNCLLLVSAHRLAKMSAIFVQMKKEEHDMARKLQADLRRTTELTDQLKVQAEGRKL